jgi:hypothetical protein
MNTSVSSKAGSLVFAFCLISMVGGKHEIVPPPRVPDSLKAPEGQVVLLKAQGHGVQIYTCKASANDPNSFAWSFKAPEADLIDARGNNIGRHSAGPTWEAGDGSRVTGEVQLLRLPALMMVGQKGQFLSRFTVAEGVDLL